MFWYYITKYSTRLTQNREVCINAVSKKKNHKTVLKIDETQNAIIAEHFAFQELSTSVFFSF